MVDKIILIASFIILLLFTGCSHKKPDINNVPSLNVHQPLPENLTACNSDSTLIARYTDPTLRYDHGILGDQIEAGGLLVIKDKKEYYYKLDTAFVFEDLQPRLKDVDNDGQMDIITIQTSIAAGASVCIYKIVNENLIPFAQSRYIGSTHRWLNIAAMEDLDNDGMVEIAWIETTHIGGALKIGRIEGDSIVVIDQRNGFSNHQIGMRNLCLSVVTFENNQKILYVPDNPHASVIGFHFQDNQIKSRDTIVLSVDMAIPLFMQYDFQNILGNENCIYVP